MRLPSSDRLLSRLRPRLPEIAIIAALTFLWVLFFWRLLTPNLADRMIFPEGDFTLHYYAFSNYQAERLWDGQIPLWNPYNHSGDFFAGNIQFVTWYPPRWIAIGLAGKGGWSVEKYQLEVAAHYWLVSLMMYAFLRLLVKRRMAALAGSVLYTYSGYLTGYPMLQVSVLESIAWLPLVMLGIQLSIANPKWLARGSIIAGLGVALSFLGGHPQTTLQIIYLALAYLTFALYRKQITWTGALARAVLLVGVGGGLASIQLLPATEFTGLSYRVTQLAYEDKANGFSVDQFAQIIWPQLFGNWSPLYIGVAGIVLVAGAVSRFRAQFVFWLGVIVVGLLLSLGRNSIVYDFFYSFVPGFSTFRQQERIAALVVFALIVLATYQLDDLLARDHDSLRYTNRLALAHLSLVALAFAVIVIAQFLSTDDLTATASILGFTALMSLLFVGWITWHRHDMSELVPAGLIILIAIDLFTVNTRSTNFVRDLPENRPQLPASLQGYSVAPNVLAWRVDGAAGLNGYGTYNGIPDIYGTGPFSLASIEELRHIPVDRFWEVLAVRYITAIDDPPPGEDVELLAYDTSPLGQEFRVFELRDPRPIAYLVYDYRNGEGSPEFTRQIMADARVNLREMAVTVDPLPIELDGTRPDDAHVDDFHFIRPEKMEMTVSTSENALLTIAVPDYPGWRATVNGESVDIVDTYAGLMGVPITRGDGQQVTLTFRPNSVIYGAILSAIALAGTLILIVGEIVLRRRWIQPAQTAST